MNKDINSWIRDNLWNLIVTFSAGVFMYASIVTRLNSVEAKVADFPSREYFELRFATLEEAVRELKATK